MAFSIQKFRAEVGKVGGIHRPSHFLVRITPPSFLVSSGYNRIIEYVCDTTILPGLDINTIDILPAGYGNSEKRPIKTSFDPIRCDFLVDNTSSFFDFFYKWTGNINNFGIDNGRSSDSTRLNYGEFAYPKEYEGTIDIYLFKPDGNSIYEIKINQAFPVSIGDLNLAWEINDSISKISVGFAYNTWSSRLLPFNAAARAIGQRYASLRNNLNGVTPSATKPTTGNVVLEPVIDPASGASFIPGATTVPRR